MSSEGDRVIAAAEAINAAHVRHCLTLLENELRWSSAYGPFRWEADPIQRNYGVGVNPPPVVVTVEALDAMVAAVPIPLQLIRAAAATMNAQKAAATRPMEHDNWGISERLMWRPGINSPGK